MSQDIQQLLSAAGLDSTTFEPASRYYGRPLVVTTTSDGEEVVHTSRRFVPPPQHFALLQYHRLEAGDRIDNLAHLYLADPEQFWKLCDGNGIDNPEELVEEIGRLIRITLPEGVQGGDDA